MQFKRENDPEFMERVKKTKREYFQRNKIEITEKQKQKYQNDPEYHEKVKTYQREYKRAARLRKQTEQPNIGSNSEPTSDATTSSN